MSERVVKETSNTLIPYPDIEQEDEIKCPSCKHIITDSWEYLDNTDRGELECPNCDINLYFEIETTIEYITWPKDELDRYRSQFNKNKEKSQNDTK